MNKKIIFTAALLCGFTSVAMAKHLPNIDGAYVCSIQNVGVKNAHTTGRFSLAQSGDVYSVTQLNADGTKPVPNEYRIFGMRSGHILSLTYQNVKNEKIFGLETMKISKDGKTLKGTFLYWNELTKKNTEVCKRV